LGDLRLILAAICLVLLGGIWWWSARGSRQARGAAELRERSNPGASHAGDDPASADRGEPAMRAEPETHSWGVPPFEPLSIKTADFEPVPVLDLEISADPNPTPAREPVRASARAAAARDRQKILTVRVAAIGPGAWPGERLMAALESQGLAFGRYQVYHRSHVDGRSVFCVASLVEPGTFDPERMPEDQFRGISLFAVLPGPLEAVPTMEELLATARALADDLGGAVQDEKGIAMSSLRMLELREEAGRFQALST
jgi:cell division protein ZipA